MQRRDAPHSPDSIERKQSCERGQNVERNEQYRGKGAKHSHNAGVLNIQRKLCVSDTSLAQVWCSCSSRACVGETWLNTSCHPCPGTCTGVARKRLDPAVQPMSAMQAHLVSMYRSRTWGTLAKCSSSSARMPLGQAETWPGDTKWRAGPVQ